MAMEQSFFQFEADFVESLRCIPMQVRLKLDTCGVKLKLEQWHRLSAGDRQQLVDRSCATPPEAATYRDVLRDRVWETTGQHPADLPVDPAPPWADASAIPQSVGDRAQELQHSITLAQWQQLSPSQRFALIKLSRSRHEHRNFLPAMQEFGLA